MAIIKRVGVLSVGKVLGCVYAVLGLLLGAMFTVISLLGSMASSRGGQGAGAILFGAGAIVIIPIMYGLIGFVGGVIAAAVYNVVASITGGIELELEQPARVGGFPVAGVMPR